MRPEGQPYRIRSNWKQATAGGEPAYGQDNLQTLRTDQEPGYERLVRVNAPAKKANGPLRELRQSAVLFVGDFTRYSSASGAATTSPSVGAEGTITGSRNGNTMS